MDPSAHDQQTINTLTPLFDTVVEQDATDGQRIKSKETSR